MGFLVEGCLTRNRNSCITIGVLLCHPHHDSPASLCEVIHTNVLTSKLHLLGQHMLNFEHKICFELNLSAFLFIQRTKKECSNFHLYLDRKVHSICQANQCSLCFLAHTFMSIKTKSPPLLPRAYKCASFLMSFVSFIDAQVLRRRMCLVKRYQR